MASENCKLTERVENIDERLTSVEQRIDRMAAETNAGFSSVNSNIETLSQQITNMDKRIIEEKVKWGDLVRSIVKWTVRTILAVVAYAAGINITKSLVALWQ